jgi:transcriptional regulator with XRE-family HTH domain
MYETIGERITYCRNLLGLSRREVVLLFGSITLPTITRWELNTTNIPTKRLKDLVIFFNANGIMVNEDWLLNGKGAQPVNKNLQSANSLNFDEIAFVNLSSLKSYIQDFEILQINTAFFEPILYNGDYIGGIFQNNIQNLNNKMCFILQNRLITVGIFNDENLILTNFYNQKIKLDSEFKIGQILWTAKRF